MDPLALALQLVCLWAIIYMLVFMAKFCCTTKVVSRRRKTLSEGILPTFSAEESTDQWSIKPFKVRYTTKRFNKLFQRLASAAPRFWDWWFSVGTIVALLAMAGGILVILYAALRIVVGFWHILSPPAPHNNNANGSSRFTKREFVEYVDGGSADSQVFQPMIPGITVPLSHLGYYLFALLICGVFHEAGHAVAAFSQRIRIKSAGIFIYYIYPGAFVNISDQALSLLSAFDQLKIICAGVWHNVVLYLWTFVFLSGGLKVCLLLLGWQSLEGLGGVSVVGVRHDSPLVYHLPSGSIVYQLDDFRLENNIISWNEYLLDDTQRHFATRGFCTAANSDDQADCCQIDEDYPFGRSVNTSLSCFRDFNPFGKPKLMACLPTTQVLVSKDLTRCTSDRDCQSGLRCVTPFTPSTRGQFVRIYTKTSPANDEENDQDTRDFVFEGELVDIWESVKVGILHPRYWFLPVWAPHTIELFLRYISSFTMALALLNILPAFHLDGEFALGQLVTLATQRSVHNPLATGRFANTQRYTQQVVKITSAVVGFVIIGSVLLGLAQA